MPFITPIIVSTTWRPFEFDALSGIHSTKKGADKNGAMIVRDN